MAYTFPEIRNFLGLHSQANTFTLPDGALEQAENVVISRDGVLTKTRGFYQYYDPASDTLNSLHNYQDKLVGVFSDKIGYFGDTGSAPSVTGSRTTLSGATVAVTGSRRSMSAQSSKNCYFTSDNGPLKIEAYNSSVYKAGVGPALDLKARFLPANGPIVGETEVAWRVLFGRRDANDNLLLGSPSDIVTLTNSKAVGATWSRTTNVVTVTYAGHNLATGMQVTVSNSVSGAPNVTSAAYTVTVTSSSQFTFAEAAANSSGTLDYTATRTTRLEGSIPSDITSAADAYFVQIYRSSQTGNTAITPSADFKLAFERKLTSAEITAGLFYFDDEYDDILLEAELYTNPNSREGELQANDRPPVCEDLTLFKNHMIYANCETRHLLDIQVVDPTVMVANDYIETKVDATTRRYVARTGVANQTVAATSVQNNGSGKLQVSYTSHGFNNGDRIYVANVVAGTLAAGTYYIVNKAASTFEISLTNGGTAVSYNSETGLDFQGVIDGASGYPMFYLESASSSASVRLRATAQGVVKAINRDASSLISARYASGLDETPGKIRLIAKGFTGTIYLRASTATVGDAFSPIFPSSFASGDQVYSRNDDQPNIFYASKIGEPEAVPLVNYFPVGARNKAILRVVALRDSMIILKEDGVFRVNGDTVSSFSITPLDQTIVCVSAASVCVLNNQVLALTNQGVVLISDTSVQIVSRKIEDVITAVLGNANLSAETGAVAYESDRQYLLTTILPNSDEAGVTYRYNVLNDTWTTSSDLLKQGVVGPNDQLYVVGTDGKLAKERKDQTRIDYCGQNHAATVISVATDRLSATISCVTANPAAGDVLVKDEVFSRIYSVTDLGSSQFTVLLERETNLEASDTPTLYKGYTSTIKLAPFHAGLVGRAKQFAQMQIHTRDESLSRLLISFSGATYGGSETVTWRTSEIAAGGSSDGWGYEPWGFFPFGLTDGINNLYGTQPASIVRVYVPRFQQRNTFIQPTFEHASAGEALNIQAVAFAVRSYGERVTR